MQRSYDPDSLAEAMYPYRNATVGFDPYTWIDLFNIALTDGEGNYALLELSGDGVYTGHYFFKEKGRKAIDLAETAVEEAFRLGVRVIRGMTPLSNMKARWFSRKIGFKSYGVVDTGVDPCELFIMTKEEWKSR